MTIDGVYQKTLFRNIKSGYTFFQFKGLKYDEDGENFYNCRGIIPNYAPKTPLTITGHKELSGDKKELLFIVDSISLNINNDILAKSFVMAHLEPGMGSACADRVIAYLKINNMTIDQLLQSDKAVEHMEQIKGFSHKKAVAFVKKAEGSLIEMDLLKELSPYGISFTQINRLRNMYERNVRTEIKENPYLSMKRAEIPFENIDAYARDNGFTFCDPDRIRSIVNQTFYYLATTGNSYCSAEEILPMYRKIEKRISCFDEQAPDGLVLFEILSSKAGYLDTTTGQPRFYSHKSWDAESEIAGGLARLKRKSQTMLNDREIDDYLNTDGSYLDDSQKEAFCLLKDTEPCFLIGGPGTGKTTTLKNLVACYQKKYPDKRVAVCAPTGRAAERIKEATGLASSTIHLLIEEGNRESMQGQGKAQMSGISTYINNIGYSNLASVKRDALIRKTQRELNSGTGAYGQLNQLLKTKGFAGIDFSSRKQAGASMEDIYKMLQRSGMASNRSGVWDLTKFDRLYRRARKGNDYSEIARALGISSISKAEMKLIGEQIHQIARRDRTGRKSTEGAVSTGKTLRSMIAHKLGQDSQVLAGYMNIKQTVQTVRSTVKAAWLMAVTTGRVIGKLGKWGGRLIGYGANTRLLRDTAFGKGYRKIDSGAKKIGGKIDDLKNHHREKKDKKYSKKEKKKTNEKKKREDRQKARRNARQARFASLAGKWNRFAPGFLRTNSFIGRTVGRVGKAVARTTKILGNVFKSIFSLIGAVSLAKAYIKKTLIYVLGGSFLIMGAAVVIISAPIDFILGFETTDDEDSTGDPIMDKTMHSLQEMETKWTDSLLNDTQGVDLTDYNLKYGSTYKTAAEYVPESGAPRIFWGQHNVKWNDLSGFTANPFGNFDLENDNTASFMNNINGGVELIYKTKDGSARTSNIKEIICMADIYTMFSTEAEDTHDDGQAVDGSESANAKQSGATFAASNKKINGDIKSWASNSMIAYAQDLFNMSHQEIIDLQYVILPTKVTKDSFDPDTTIVDGENNTSVKVTQCPDYDLGGCQIYENFYYDKNGIAVKDKDGNLHTAGGVYPLRKNNMEFDKDESGNIINTEYCFADSVAGFGNIYNSDNAACWKTELQDSKSDEIEDYSEPSESGISDAVKSLTGDKEYVTGFSWNDAGYFVLTTEVVGETKTHIDPEWVIDVPGHPEIGHIALNPYQATDVESRTYHVTHECVGDHHGRYCGGHLKAKITGVIYGFTDAEVGAEETGVMIAGKVEDGAFIHKDSNKFVLNDSNVFKTAQDIFDIDAACTHPNEREDWEGWTEENIELTLLKYNMDWEDLYGFDLTTTLGGQALTSADTQEIMKQIRENYPGLSEERLSVVERGLNYVGKIGYSQTHHNCPLEGPCLISKSGPCYLSDCSGFTSNLWIDELGGIYTTDGFRIMLNGKFDSSKNLPGDIIVHYDPNGNHALLYIGEFEYDGTYQTWSIDCSTVKGVGNVFLRHRDYYDSCFYISPAP